MAKRLIREAANLVIHHYTCAHVARRSAFAQPDLTLLCPKCHDLLAADRSDWETLPDPPKTHGAKSSRRDKAVSRSAPSAEEG